jgi:aminoglycoside 3-N-acetyltransferase
MAGDRAVPLGRADLAASLRALGLRPGQDLLVHCSMRRIGPVDGGPATLLEAITDVAGPDATIAVPTMTLLNSFSSSAFRTATAGLTTQEYDKFVADMPGFDPLTTPSVGMGALAEHVRTHPDRHRSTHPLTSFAALGPAARSCAAVHDLSCHLGDRSPLGWLYASDAAILLLGVGYSVCTAFHLAEYRIPGRQRPRQYRCFVCRDGIREPREFTGIELDDGDFPALGNAYDVATGGPVGSGPSAGCGPRRGLVGAAGCRLVPMRAAVGFACTWMAEHRKWP